MNIMKCWIFITLMSLMTNFCFGIADITQPSKRCVMERAHRMLGYNCARLELQEVPKNLKSSTEVLDVSYNRIREVTRQSFKTLKDLRFLYIFDNMITLIEEDSFAELKYLEALDLSNNNLIEVPAHIFNLPLLRNLYMSDMHFGDRGFATLENINKPMKAPLNVLSIANLRLERIPEFGVLPYLYRLNISHNPMSQLVPQQFSPFCHLKEIDYYGIGRTEKDRCRCEAATRFLLKNRDAELLTQYYCDEISSSKTYSDCRIDPNVTFAETHDYHVCAKIRQNVIEHKRAQITWGFIGAGVVGFLIFFIGCLYCIHRHNVRKMRTKSKLNNHNVKVIPAKQLDANENAEISNTNSESTNPEKLLIGKRSEV